MPYILCQLEFFIFIVTPLNFYYAKIIEEDSLDIDEELLYCKNNIYSMPSVTSIRVILKNLCFLIARTYVIETLLRYF